MEGEEGRRSEVETGLSGLALRARRGESLAADLLFSALLPRITRGALALGASPADVPDLVQDVLLAGHRSLASFDPDRGSLEAWFFAILVHRVRNGRRADGRRRHLVSRLLLLAPRQTAPTAADAVEARLALARLLSFLTGREREVVALYEIAELSAEEAGSLLGISAAGIRSIARDARARLASAAAADRFAERKRR